jgi:hypothetical protein
MSSKKSVSPLKVILVISAIIVVLLLVIGAVHNKGVKDNYAAPLSKVTESVVKDVSTGANLTMDKAKEITQKK